MVSGSWSQYCSRSLLLTSALLPIETKLETPSPRLAAWPSSSIPSAPDWLAKPIWPRIGRNGANVAFIDTSGSVLTTPMPFGPTRRMPCSRACSTSSCSTPALPRSANPALITMRPWTPFRAASRTTSATDAAGTVMTARSTSSGTSRIVG